MHTSLSTMFLQWTTVTFLLHRLFLMHHWPWLHPHMLHMHRWFLNNPSSRTRAYNRPSCPIINPIVNHKTTLIDNLRLKHLNLTHLWPSWLDHSSWLWAEQSRVLLCYGFRCMDNLGWGYLIVIVGVGEVWVLRVVCQRMEATEWLDRVGLS